MSNTDDKTTIQPLSQALATFDIPLILTEAKRTHDALATTTTTQARLTRWRPDLQTIYRTQFDTATAHLAAEHKLHLLTICFAYKTRARVLAFLEHVADSFSWAAPLKEVVEVAGRDSEGGEGGDGDEVGSAREDLHAVVGFTIPTLAIAYPKHFFLAWASYVPLAGLAVEELLAHPAACGLGLQREVKGEVREKMGEFGGGEGWEGFLATLCVGRTELAWCAKGREGYAVRDVEAWVARWRGMREREGELVSVLGKRGAREDSVRPVKRVRWVDEGGVEGV
ncbi:hypothetical protein P171DRAFT_484511 [Karstenula rhodostoma CBS 690.94]|uniref:Uncharacterized protein n=1 Tax=Karstenula rhodostoma CBS 690.94 TaxID=1392251 RepID=A0A9P4PIT5_9PLEO|nr:hypothetical protein P171DRAFT_484511 [Karstenula rhodostoma CBS 690.94]